MTDNNPDHQTNNVEEMTFQIHFKENSIPSIHAGKLTKESIAELSALVMECVGEDEPESVKLNGKTSFPSMRRRINQKQGRNQLRSEIKDHLAKKGIK